MTVLKHSLFQHTLWMNQARQVLNILSTKVRRCTPHVTALLLPTHLLYLQLFNIDKELHHTKRSGFNSSF